MVPARSKQSWWSVFQSIHADLAGAPAGSVFIPRLASLALHCAAVVAAILAAGRRSEPVLPRDATVWVNAPLFAPREGSGLGGRVGTGRGGGGGGGHDEPTPPAHGRLAPVSSFSVPDPEQPLPLVPADDVAAAAALDVPLDFPQDLLLPIGAVTAPSGERSSRG